MLGYAAESAAREPNRCESQNQAVRRMSCLRPTKKLSVSPTTPKLDPQPISTDDNHAESS
jgi:hypothetical protein